MSGIGRGQLARALASLQVGSSDLSLEDLYRGTLHDSIARRPKIKLSVEERFDEGLALCISNMLPYKRIDWQYHNGSFKKAVVTYASSEFISKKLEEWIYYGKSYFISEVIDPGSEQIEIISIIENGSRKAVRFNCLRKF